MSQLTLRIDFVFICHKSLLGLFSCSLGEQTTKYHHIINLRYENELHAMVKCKSFQLEPNYKKRTRVTSGRVYNNEIQWRGRLLLFLGS